MQTLQNSAKIAILIANFAELWGFAPDPTKGGLMAPPSALPRQVSSALRADTTVALRATVRAHARDSPE